LANRSLQPLSVYRFGATFQKGERAMVGWITRNGDRKQALYDPRTGAGFSQIHPREASTNGVKATSLDGTLIAFVGRRLDGQGYALEVIEVATGDTKHAFPLDVSSYTAVRFTPDARQLLLATNRAVVRIDYRKRQFDVIADGSRLANSTTKPAESSQENSRSTGGAASAAALGARSEVADGTWIRASGASIDSGASDSDPIRSMDISRNGWMFTGHRSGIVNIWNGYTGEHIRSIHNPPDPIELLAVSPDGSKIACAPRESGIVYMLDLHRILPPQSPTPPDAEPESSEEPGLSLEIK
jgi:WD40 repeat protein